MSDEQIAHLADDPPPDDVFDPAELTVVAYAQRLTRMERIDDRLYSQLASHFQPEAIIELCLIIGSANMVNRFHATFLTDVEAATSEALSGSCPIPLPPRPGG